MIYLYFEEIIKYVECFKGLDMVNLEEKYNLIEQSPIDRVIQNPIAENLKRVPKKTQTLELLMMVCARDGRALKYASKKLITSELCEVAVKQNGAALEYIPDKIFKINKEIRSDDSWAIQIYKDAVKTDGYSLKYIPEEYIDKEMVIDAISSEKDSEPEKFRYPIAFIPEKFKTHEIYKLSVIRTPYSIKHIKETREDYYELVKLAVNRKGKAINCVSEKYRNKELYLAALKNDSMVIESIPEELINKEISEYCIKDNYETFPYIPACYISEEMCEGIIKNGYFSVFRKFFPRDNFREPVHEYISFFQFPNDMRENKRIIDRIILQDNGNAQRLLDWDAKVKGALSEKDDDTPLTNKRGEIIKPLKKKIYSYIKSKAELIENELSNSIVPIQLNASEYEDLVKKYSPKIPESYDIVPLKHQKLIVHDFSEFEYSSKKLFYIFDIHIEHQLESKYKNIIKKRRLNNKEASELLISLIDEKISEMIGDAELNKGLLLVGGDVSNSVELTELFYKRLSKKWKGTIISILGNHELWDGFELSNLKDPKYKAREVDTVIKDYRERISNINDLYFSADISLLENEIFIIYKNKQICTISQEDLQLCSDKELGDLLSKCSLIIFGGIGYSGLNPFYNASLGLYCKTVDVSEDRRRSEIFRTLHDKIARCASDKNVVVLSHTPVYDWMPEINCVPNWIYINGHTHRNSLCRNEDGTVILSDNQVGYKPQKWKLNSVMLNCWYDPFEKYEDGVYKINSEKYKEFYYGRGIYNKGCNYPGILYLLKKSGLYMFLLESGSSLCLMAGGQRKKLDVDDIYYYYDNMDIYGNRIRELIKPYQKALEAVSKEVKLFGGSGVIHGCIVDISFYSHIYINPYDGKITPYWALDTLSRMAFPDVKSLLIKCEQDLVEKYQIATEKESFSLLAESSKKKVDVATIPKWVLGADIYKESRIMKSIQYVWQHNVIRIWNDAVFDGNIKTVPRINKSHIDKKINESRVEASANNHGIVIEKKSELITSDQYYSIKKKDNKYVGKSNVMKNGKKATIIEFITRWDITVRFEDGHEVEHKTIWDFNKGNIE